MRPSFEALRMRYQSVIDEAHTQGVQITNLHEQDGKLVIKGTAPSLEAANKVWDEIKRVDPRMESIYADFNVEQSRAGAKENLPATEVYRSKPTAPSETLGESAQTYTVKAGDTLVKISKHFYGDSHHFTKIFDANKDTLKQPNMIKVGQELKIPMK